MPFIPPPFPPAAKTGSGAHARLDGDGGQASPTGRKGPLQGLGSTKRLGDVPVSAHTRGGA
eukprot:10649704-Alexandrium_andersonii.AAC.1